MIKRLEASDFRPSHDEWPEEKRSNLGRQRYLFAPRQAYRKLRVMVDVELLQPADPKVVLTPEQVLTELLESDLITTMRYRDGGPPAEVTPRSVQEGTDWRRDVYDGWAVVTGERSDFARSVVCSDGRDGYRLSAVAGNAVEVAADDTRTNAYADLDSAAASQRRTADALAGQVALQAVEADIYVTVRPYLQAVTPRFMRGVTVCSPAEALPLAGLYLRAQGAFIVLDRYSFNRGLYYQVGALELLHETWRWHAACAQHAVTAEEDRLLYLAGSLPQRFTRALEIRDQIHLALNQPQNNDTQDAALSALDTVLTFLMGAVDVTARVAHYVLKLPGGQRQAAWQYDKWLKKVRSVEADLAAVVGPDTTAGHALTILSLLRNSIHAATLQGVAYRDGRRPLETLVRVPEDDEPKLSVAMEATGGRTAWGARLVEPGDVYLDAGILVDRLFEAVIELLNSLMKATPVERLPHVALSDADCRPPAEGTDGRSDGFAEWQRRSIRWQLGF